MCVWPIGIKKYSLDDGKYSAANAKWAASIKCSTAKYVVLPGR